MAKEAMKVDEISNNAPRIFPIIAHRYAVCEKRRAACRIALENAAGMV